MVSLLIALLAVIVIAGVGYWAVTQLAAAFGLPAPIVVIAQVVIVIFAVVLVVQKSGILHSWGSVS